MSAQDDTYTYDRAAADGGPYVPDEDALGGDEDADDAQNPPVQGEQWYAGKGNEIVRNVAGLNRCAWWATIWVEWDGVSAYNVTAVDCMGTTPTTASVTATPSATGVVVLSWTAGTFPAMARKPRVWLTDDQGSAYGEVTTANSITVNLVDLANTAQDVNFAVELR
jgi:hypothetical protein